MVKYLTLSNTLGLISSINMTDQVSHPYITTGKIIVLYIFMILPFCYVFQYVSILHNGTWIQNTNNVLHFQKKTTVQWIYESLQVVYI
jgi:hypothetical protein